MADRRAPELQPLRGPARRSRESASRLRAPRMLSRPLREDHDQDDDHDCKDRRGERAAPFEAALVDGLVEEVADGRPERAGEDERGPEEADAVRLRREVEDRQKHEPGAEYHCAARIAETPSAVA